MEKVIKIWLTDSEIWIQTEDGKTASDNFGIHWEKLDEDLNFDGFFQKKNE